jgi:hypothetical protein
MKIGMTGNRYSMSTVAEKVLRHILVELKVTEGHHGDCVGADLAFHNVLDELGLQSVIHPPTNKSNRAFCNGTTILPTKSYLDRNKDIVDDSQIMIAFPNSEEEQIRSGTWSTIRYARKKKRKIFIVFPNGKVTLNNNT